MRNWRVCEERIDFIDQLYAKKCFFAKLCNYFEIFWLTNDSPIIFRWPWSLNFRTRFGTCRCTKSTIIGHPFKIFLNTTHIVCIRKHYSKLSTKIDILGEDLKWFLDNFVPICLFCRKLRGLLCSQWDLIDREKWHIVFFRIWEIEISLLFLLRFTERKIKTTPALIIRIWRKRSWEELPPFTCWLHMVNYFCFKRYILLGGIRGIQDAVFTSDQTATSKTIFELCWIRWISYKTSFHKLKRKHHIVAFELNSGTHIHLFSVVRTDTIEACFCHSPSHTIHNILNTRHKIGILHILCLVKVITINKLSILKI